MFTPWGYEVEELPPLITKDRYNALTANKNACDFRLEVLLEAASEAIRNECGWHIFPSLKCKATLSPNGKVVALPATLVTDVYSVTEQGKEITGYEVRQEGLLRRTNFKSWLPAYNSLVVEYQAGYDKVSIIEAAVMNLVEASFAVPAGIKSESAGGVSVSYASQLATMQEAITGNMLSALAPYRLVMAYAT